MQKVFCFILPHFLKEYQGGAELQCYYIGKELIKRNWTVHYIRESKAPLEAPQENEGFILHSLPKRYSYLRWKNKKILRAKMKAIKADVWYLRATRDYIPLTVSIAKQTGGKVIWACSRDPQLSRFHLKSKERPVASFLNLLVNLVSLQALPKVDKIVVQTAHQQNILKKKFGLNGMIIQNAHPYKSADSNEPRENLILWISRLQPWKRPSLFAELAKYFCTNDYRFVAVGKDFSEELKLQFTNAAKELPNFSYLGEVTNEEVLKLLQKAKLLINTSKNEGFSNTFIEAWLQGVPIVSYEIDPDEIIEKNNLGIVCNSSFENMMKAVSALLTDDAYWARTSINCITYVKANFIIESSVDKLEQIIAELNG